MPGVFVATALTVYGIETCHFRARIIHMIQLQQHLPFTVLKLVIAVLVKPNPS